MHAVLLMKQQSTNTTAEAFHLIKMALQPADALPFEIVAMIIQHLDGDDLRNAASVNRQWRSACHAFRDTRNKAMYQFLLRDVLGAFSPKYWVLSGSASYWLLRYMQSRDSWVNPGAIPYWTPNDADVWYVGPPGQSNHALMRPFEEDVPAFLEADAQPADVHPFTLRPHEGELSAYRCNYKIERSVIPIHVCLSPCTVFRSGGSNCVEAKFDMQFLQITVVMRPAVVQGPEPKMIEFTTSYWPDRAKHQRQLMPSRVKKYTARLGSAQFQAALVRKPLFKSYARSPF